MSKQRIIVDILSTPEGLRVNVAAEPWLSPMGARITAEVAATIYAQAEEGDRRTRKFRELPSAAFAGGTVIEHHYAEEAKEKGA